MSDHSQYELYQELRSAGFGMPLWYPTLDNGYIKIGDVGFMRGGQFIRLFRATSTEEEIEELGDSAPDDFRRLELSESRIQRTTRRPFPIRSTTVTSCGMTSGGASGVELFDGVTVVPGSSIKFEFSGGKCALFLTRHDSPCLNTIQSGTLKDYIKKHYWSWKELARACGYDDVDPILVSGIHSSRDYAMLACASSEKQFSASITARVPVGSFWANGWAKCTSMGTSYVNWGPDPEEESIIQRIEPDSSSGAAAQPLNGYVTFIQGFYMRIRFGVIPEVMKAGAKLENLDPEDPDPEASAEFVSELQLENINPLDIVFNFLFQNSTAEYALIHDDDLRPISEIASCYNESIEDVLERCPPSAVTMDDDGVASFLLEHLMSWNKDALKTIPVSSKEEQIGHDQGDEYLVDTSETCVELFSSVVSASDEEDGAKAKRSLPLLQDDYVETDSFIVLKNLLRSDGRSPDLRVEKSVQGTDNQLIWIVEIFIANVRYGHGEGPTEMIAEQIAASVTVDKLLGSKPPLLASEHIFFPFAFNTRYNSIQLHRNSLAFRISAYPLRTDSPNNIATAAMTQFHIEGVIHLDESIELHRKSLAVCPPGHPDHSMCLNNLAVAVMERFEHAGAIIDLEESMELHRQSLSVCPLGHPDHSMSLNNLAVAIMRRFEQVGDIIDLGESIELLRDALALCPPGHPHRSSSLINLGSAVQTRFEQVGAIIDLDEAIELNRNALALLSPGHPKRFMSLHNLAAAVLRRFEHTGDLADLDEALELNRNVLALLPLSHPDRSMSLNNLATAILTRFEQTGALADLNEAVELNRNALALLPSGHSNRSIFLSGLANAILKRFQLKGAIEDVDEAIQLNRESLELLPYGHPDRSMSLNNLANAVLTRFQHQGAIEDVDKAIQLNKEGLRLLPYGHPDRSMSLNNLANVVLTRFQQKGAIEDLDGAIELQRNALALLPLGHPYRLDSLSNLAGAVMTRFKRAGDIEDLVEASKDLSDAENSASVHSRGLYLTWCLLAESHIQHYRIDSDKNHISSAFYLFCRAAEHDAAGIKQRLIAALHWAAVARDLSHDSLLRAYSTALELLNRYVVSSPSVERQLLRLSVEIPRSLALDAAASAIEVGQLKAAVQFLEQGRTLLWAEVRRFRHPVEELRAASPGLASEFESISRRLEMLALSLENAPFLELCSDHQTVRGDNSIPKVTRYPMSRSPEVYDAKIREQRKLSQQWDVMVEKIRLMDGFTDFLKAAPFTALQRAATDGPVIIVNISRLRSDAIVILKSIDPVLVPLPKATPDILSNLYTRFHKSKERFHKDKYLSEELCENLGQLWRIVVGPVVDELGRLGVAKGSRIWWCPTSYLCGLPLHAAGPFVPDAQGHFSPDHMWLPDLYVSSYTSSLSVLATVRSNMASETNNPSLLVIAQPQFLRYVDEEVRRIKKFDRIVETMVGEEATHDAVLRRLSDHPYVHFACNTSNRPKSFHSSFVLGNDDHLELIDIMKARLTNAEHAFLSSCHSAATDIEGNPEEMISLAAGLQFCGYKGVVGTLWGMEDADGPSIAEDFYGHMFRHGVDGKVDVKDSAQALNMAIQEMKKRRGLIGQWINFIHIGI